MARYVCDGCDGIFASVTGSPGIVDAYLIIGSTPVAEEKITVCEHCAVRLCQLVRKAPRQLKIEKGKQT